jgi:hypothetical protein
VRYIVISAGYLLAGVWAVRELMAHRAPRQSYWICLLLLAAGWAWSVYAVTTMRPPSPLELIEEALQRIPWLSPWVSE